MPNTNLTVQMNAELIETNQYSNFELAITNIEQDFTEETVCIVKDAAEYFLKHGIFSEEEIADIITLLPLSQIEDLDEINEDILKRFLEARPECYNIILAELRGEISADPRYDEDSRGEDPRLENWINEY